MKHLADSERNGRMERVYAFTDEYGAFGWDIDNPSVSTHFIITAVIVKESNLSVFTQKANNLRKRHFQTGEIKSSRIGKDHNRRLRVLSDLQDIPFSFFSVCIDKKKCKENMSTRGLQYKKSFYKFMNNIVHREFRRAFEKIGIYFKIGILLAANDETLNKNGWSGHFHYAKKLLDQGCNTIYVFGIGKKANVASKIAYAVKDSDDRIVKSITHQYRHLNIDRGIRTTAVCVELDTY